MILIKIGSNWCGQQVLPRQFSLLRIDKRSKFHVPFFFEHVSRKVIQNDDTGGKVTKKQALLKTSRPQVKLVDNNCKFYTSIFSHFLKGHRKQSIP